MEAIMKNVEIVADDRREDLMTKMKLVNNIIRRGYDWSYRHCVGIEKLYVETIREEDPNHELSELLRQLARL